jgi:rubrerythrin
MALGHSHTERDDLYFECIPCGYAAPMEHAIGLCPRCGETLSETSAFA